MISGSTFTGLKASAREHFLSSDTVDPDRVCYICNVLAEFRGDDCPHYNTTHELWVAVGNYVQEMSMQQQLAIFNQIASTDMQRYDQPLDTTPYGQVNQERVRTCDLPDDVGDFLSGNFTWANILVNIISARVVREIFDGDTDLAVVAIERDVRANNFLAAHGAS